MATLYGIDISEHNGTLNWPAIKQGGDVDFVIIRAGYGQGNTDRQWLANAQGCEAQGIPWGVYWFSYATSLIKAKQEAGYCIQQLEALQSRSLFTLGIWYDWEYDSDDYAAQQGVTVTNTTRTQFAEAFLSECATQGYPCGIYTNIDYLSRGHQAVVDDGYPLWLAQWGVTQPSQTCAIWQWGIDHVAGISGDVDGDIIGDGYPPIGPTPPIPPTPTRKKTSPLWPYLRYFI